MPKIARSTGLLYLLIVIGGVFAEAFVRSRLIDYQDALLTAVNINGAESLFRLGISIELLVFISDAAVTALLYILLRPLNKTLALLAAGFRLVTVSILGANLINNFLPLLLLSESSYLAALKPDQLQALTLFYLKAHGIGYSLALAFFSFHCMLIGYIISRSKLIPKFFGVLLIIAGLCYFTHSFSFLIWPELSAKLFPFILLPCLLAELLFSLRLLLKGVKPIGDT